VTEAPLTVAVFASGGGTNFQALLDHRASHALWRVGLLVMNREAGAKVRAEHAGVPVVIIPTRDRDARAVSTEIARALDEHSVDVILLSGYLRLLPPEVVRRFAGRILNIHPALLPDFGGPGMYGMNVHRAVVASEADVSGATVHFVSESYDDGATLAQWQVEVLPTDTPDELAARVLRVEHRLYPRAVDHLARALLEGRTPERMPDIRLDQPPAEVRSSQLTHSNEEAE
jgi:phosphoribosylglycinamide formyltransferase 1